MLTAFVKKAFRGIFELILWFILIGSAISGAIVGNASEMGGGGVLGFVLGAILGFLLIVLLGGFLATFLDMAKDIEELKPKSESRSSEDS